MCNCNQPAQTAIPVRGRRGFPGADGTNGVDGADGADGTDGASAELRVSGGYIQWRQSDDDPTWANLISIASITGTNGTNGTDATSPAGAVQMYAGAAAPAGYLFCDGASVLRATYAALFTAIGVAWGSVDGTHFNVPDMRGRAPIGVGTGSGLTARALAASGGYEQWTLTESEMPSHYHAIEVDTAGTGTDGIWRATGTIRTADNTAATANRGGDNPHPNMQPFKALNFIIKI